MVRLASDKNVDTLLGELKEYESSLACALAQLIKLGRNGERQIRF
jgi:hypothetical protein